MNNRIVTFLLSGIIVAVSFWIMIGCFKLIDNWWNILNFLVMLGSLFTFITFLSVMYLIGGTEN